MCWIMALKIIKKKKVLFSKFTYPIYHQCVFNTSVILIYRFSGNYKYGGKLKNLFALDISIYSQEN